MKGIVLFLAVLTLPLMVTAQKKVAVWETETNSPNISSLKKELVRSGLEEAVDYTQGYVKYDRAKFEDVLKEHKFQRSGAVKDNDVKRMGEYAGVQFVIVPQVEMEGMDFLIVARVINVETGESKTRKETCGATPQEIDKACTRLATRLLGSANGGSGTNERPGGNGGGNVQRGQDFTETAFGINMKMVYVEGGTFIMGCTSEQGGECDDDESPNRQTTVSSFYMGMLEVTQGQWQKVMGTDIYQQRNKRDPSLNLYGVGQDYPMYYVSWEEAKEFCARLSRQTGRTYRLPTEAEWEYAARGGKKNEGTKYAGGWSVGDVAWYDGNSSSSTHPCGTKRGNALGLYDMSGNVWEWCEDWYGNQYLQYDNNNPKGATSGSYRVFRGGSWSFNVGYCRVSNRSGNAPSSRDDYLGFRVVLVP